MDKNIVSKQKVSMKKLTISIRQIIYESIGGLSWAAVFIIIVETS